MIDTATLAPATVLLMALYDYRCALWQAQQHGTRPPAGARTHDSASSSRRAGTAAYSARWRSGLGKGGGL